MTRKSSRKPRGSREGRKVGRILFLPGVPRCVPNGRAPLPDGRRSYRSEYGSSAKSFHVCAPFLWEGNDLKGPWGGRQPTAAVRPGGGHCAGACGPADARRVARHPMTAQEGTIYSPQKGRRGETPSRCSAVDDRWSVTGGRRAAAPNFFSRQTHHPGAVFLLYCAAARRRMITVAGLHFYIRPQTADRGGEEGESCGRFLFFKILMKTSRFA